MRQWLTVLEWWIPYLAAPPQCCAARYSVSTDSGATWSLPISYDPTLISPVCEASFVRIGDFLYFRCGEWSLSSTLGLAFLFL